MQDPFMTQDEQAVLPILIRQVTACLPLSQLIGVAQRMRGQGKIGQRISHVGVHFESLGHQAA
jgi:hypothetical protein